MGPHLRAERAGQPRSECRATSARRTLSRRDDRAQSRRPELSEHSASKRTPRRGWTREPDTVRTSAQHSTNAMLRFAPHSVSSGTC